MSNEESLAVIELRDVSILSPRTTDEIIARGINWSIYENDFWVVCGLSGAGKTALMLTAAGIQKPAEGDLFIFGKNIKYLSEDELAGLRLKIGFVFEGRGNLFHDLTIGQNIVLPLRYHLECSAKVAKEKAMVFAEFLGIEQYIDSYPNEIPPYLLSRVTLARALITEPKILFVDNPMRSLDVSQERWWIEKLLILLKDNKNSPAKQLTTLIVAVSDLRLWINHIHKIAVLSSNGYKYFSRDEIKEDVDSTLKELLVGVFKNY
ncbi:MAG TPA: ATP-binding cassette domain-containing protein [Verrucomicrobiota bacterium]|nr:ATP-binding cassette domain-containing protein [Verrucomicrobiota bacterium]